MEEDRELVILLKAGNIEALEQLIMRWRCAAEAYAFRVLHDSQAAEDAVQEAFSRIYAVRTDLDEERSFSALLFTVVKRICIDTLRKQKHFPLFPGELPETPADSAETEYFRHWERLNLIHLVAGLDEEDRKILLAFSLEGKPTRQIAQQMHLTDGQVRIRLHRIRKKLKKGMRNDEQ